MKIWRKDIRLPDRSFIWQSTFSVGEAQSFLCVSPTLYRSLVKSVPPEIASSRSLRANCHTSLGIRQRLLLVASLVIKATAQNGRHFMLTK
jgi:hypothetical protein